MMNSWTHRRRASVRHPHDDNGDSPSLFESIVNHLTDGLARSAMRRVNHGLHEVVRWTLLRLTFAWIGAALMAGGVLLLLAGSVKGMEALHCPLWLACLLTGLFTVIVGLVAIKGLLWPMEEDI